MRKNGADDYVAQAAVSSALWAAWADAAGFITELTDLKGVKRRVRDSRPLPEGSALSQLSQLLNEPVERWLVQGTMGWSRRIGGRGGASVKLPAGTYSDDTQLRLATSRCIDAGRYDPRTFAHIELPTFTCYALGGGNSTKAGAAALAKTNPSWAAPGHASWGQAGGNGVLMRVAPLAYAAAAYGSAFPQLCLDVIRNGVVTHGHPRGLLPACLHAVVLAETLRHRKLAPLQVVHHRLEELRQVPTLMASDPVLAEQTLPAFELAYGTRFDLVWQETVSELHDILARFEHVSPYNPPDGYLDAANDVGLFSPDTRGSGTATFAAAYWIAHTYRHDPRGGILLAVNAVGTDTDTIATIAGAHLGVVVPFDPQLKVLDHDYIEAETLRVVAPFHDLAGPPMRYPDLDGWRVPRAQADYVGIDPASGRVAVAGLGAGEWMSAPVRNEGNPEFAWQWFQTDYGQSLPVKRRSDLPVLPQGALPSVPTQGKAGQPTVAGSRELDELRARMERANAASKGKAAPGGPYDANKRGDRRGQQLASASHGPDDTEGRQSHDVRLSNRPSLQSALEYAEGHDYDDEVVGRLIRVLAAEVSADAAIAFVGQALAHWRGRRRR